MRRVCLVGAGNIARVHAEALRSIPGVRITAVVDPDLAAARRLAATWQVPRIHASVQEALAAAEWDAAHVLVPPQAHHDAALPLLAAGKSVLVEKPLAAAGAECEVLRAAAHESGAALGVNQNFLFHPAFLRLRERLGSGAFGRPTHVDCIYNLPLRQLAARQFGHWMFQAPQNLLLEQAVHPLSQILALAGPTQSLRAMAGAPMEIAPGLRFHLSANVLLAGRGLPAQLRFAVGQSFPLWQITVTCDDGVLVADMLANRFVAHARTRWPEVVDGVLSAGRSAGALLGAACHNAADFGLSMLRLQPRSDPFFRSMQSSIAAWHRALDGGASYPADGDFGAMLVATCERIAEEAFGAAPAPQPRSRPASADAPCDIAVLGGTGFIGAHLVRRLRQEGLRVAVMARSIANLPTVFHDPQVVLHRGDIRDEAAVLRAIGTAPVVVNLAHGGGSGGLEALRQAMVGGAETVARACLARGVRRLIHLSSIAALYLGPQRGAVTGDTPPDTDAERRADYARAKAMTDRLLLGMHAREGLPVCILRPGLVVGEGASPLHGGLGFFNNEQHCIGWNGGRNPLPFVLVEDVAEAILLASRAARVDGKCYNLVGDVRPTAREFVAALAHALRRPLRFHPQQSARLWANEYGKWLVKRAGGRADPPPSWRDIVSRGLSAEFDCSDAKRDLGWRPVADAGIFTRRAIAVHAP